MEIWGSLGKKVGKFEKIEKNVKSLEIMLKKKIELETFNNSAVNHSYGLILVLCEVEIYLISGWVFDLFLEI